MDYSEIPMIEIAEEIMAKKKQPQSIREIVKEVLEIKGIDSNDGDRMAQLYVDITISSKFVYCGKEKWDLKAKQPLELWDKDGSEFNDKEDFEEQLAALEELENGGPVKAVEQEEEIIVMGKKDDDDEEDDDNDNDDEDNEEADNDDEEIENIQNEPIKMLEDDNDVDDDVIYDEDKYNSIMDDYEDLYDK